jgi:hypothetical protein
MTHYSRTCVRLTPTLSRLIPSPMSSRLHHTMSSTIAPGLHHPSLSPNERVWSIPEVRRLILSHCDQSELAQLLTLSKSSFPSVAAVLFEEILGTEADIILDTSIPAVRCRGYSDRRLTISSDAFWSIPKLSSESMHGTIPVGTIFTRNSLYCFNICRIYSGFGHIPLRSIFFPHKLRTP